MPAARGSLPGLRFPGRGRAGRREEAGAAIEAEWGVATYRTVEELGLTTAKPVAAPGVKDGGPAVSTGDDALSRPERELYARAVGRVLYVSLYRYDIQYVTRLLTRVLVCPCRLDLHRLRHLTKFLLGTKDWAWVFAWQTKEEAAQLRGQSDSDWAQDKHTRRSVSSGFVARGRHVLETWTQGQQLIALSSGEAEFYAAGSAAARLAAAAAPWLLLRGRPRAPPPPGPAPRAHAPPVAALDGSGVLHLRVDINTTTVSYTHLTLPTNREV